MATRQTVMKSATASILIILLFDFLETVLAQSDYEPEGSLRLVDGTTENEGRIEIFHNGEWGTVCDDGWDMVDGEVACRQLGYPGAEMTYFGGEFGLGYGRIWLDDMQCIFGTEKTLLDCSHSWVHNCDHSEDAGLKCTPSTEEGSVRLRAGLSQMEGRLEIYYDEKWGTVCDDSWDAMDSKVVCKQLGFTGSSDYFRAIDNGFMVELSSETPIYLDTVECVGDELTLDYCRHDGWGVHDCSHEEDIAVKCYVQGGGLSGGAIAGIVIGSLVGVFLVCLCCCRSRKKKPPTHQHTAVPTSDESRAGAVALDDVHGGTPDPNNIHPGVDAANMPPPSYNDIKDFKTAPYPPASAAYGHPPPSVHYPPASAPYSQATAPYPPPTEPYPPPTAPYPPPTAPIPPPSSSAITHPYPSGYSGMVPSAPPVYPPTNPDYPPTNPGYPPNNPDYPPTNPAYPPTNPSHPTTNPPTSTPI